MLGAVGVCHFSSSWLDTQPLSNNLFQPDCFKRIILWALTYEVLGFGCGSGPLTARYLPPFAACFHFGRAKTFKLPLFKTLPFVSGHHRSYLEAGAYWLFIGLLMTAITSPKIESGLLSLILILLLILTLSDKTIFLAARGEHYGTMAVCFLFEDQWLVGVMSVQVALWLWAAVSKLTPHFPSVVATMVSNSAVIRKPRLRQWLYRRYPDDLRPSVLTQAMAHSGTFIEFAFPLCLVFGDGGPATTIGLFAMVLFHIYITIHCPVAVPLEWNVVMIYGGLFMFLSQPSTAFLSPVTPVLGSFLVFALVLVPAWGQLRPQSVSFLLAMRYYAGNWPYSVWLFKDKSISVLEQKAVTASRHPKQQLGRLYGPDVVAGSLQLVEAFRAMHLQGRPLNSLLPRAVDGENDYDYHDGEVIAGWLLGWNFGDGHLHNEQLLNAVQEQCQFKSGELRCIFVEGQPLLRREMDWRIVDAADGLLERGSTTIDMLFDQQPWPEPTVRSEVDDAP